MADELPKLRLQLPETAEQLARRHEKEKRAASLQREDELAGSLAPFRVGSVPYLNAVPLTRGLEDQVIFATPAKLAEMLQRGELDAALVSVTEVLFNDRYDVLDGIAVASLGEVQSVFLAHPDFVLLIGDPALDLLRADPAHQVWDLGTAWMELTRLPFVYAVWALRRGIENQALRRRLRDAKDFGFETLDYIISERAEYDYHFRKDYLGWHIHYHLGADEKRGLIKFMELLRRHGLGPVYEPRFVA